MSFPPPPATQTPSAFRHPAPHEPRAGRDDLARHRPRSDIYSLGVLLYELLTGSTPIDTATLRQAGLDEIRRIIRFRFRGDGGVFLLVEKPPVSRMACGSWNGVRRVRAKKRSLLDSLFVSGTLRVEISA